MMVDFSEKPVNKWCQIGSFRLSSSVPVFLYGQPSLGLLYHLMGYHCITISSGMNADAVPVHHRMEKVLQLSETKNRLEKDVFYHFCI